MKNKMRPQLLPRLCRRVGGEEAPVNSLTFILVMDLTKMYFLLTENKNVSCMAICIQIMG